MVQSIMDSPVLVVDGLVFGESPRWHGGRLYVSDWGAGEVLAVAAEGRSEVVAQLRSFPMCIDFLPDERLVLVNASDRTLLVQEPDGSLRPIARLGGSTPWNDIVIDGRGNTYVNNIGFTFPGGEFAPGSIALVTQDGTVRQVAEGLAFPNGMAVTADNSTLIVAESYADRLTAYDIGGDGGLSGRRAWAQLGASAAPDGICIDAAGAVWYASVPGRCCVRVADGGEVLDRVELDRGAFACILGERVEGDRVQPVLFVVTNEWTGTATAGQGRTGQVVQVPAPAPAAGWPG